MFLILIWLAGIAAAMSRRWIRTRRDAWPIVILWPLALALVIAILVYEGGVRLFRLARREMLR